MYFTRNKKKKNFGVWSRARWSLRNPRPFLLDQRLNFTQNEKTHIASLEVYHQTLLQPKPPRGTWLCTWHFIHVPFPLILQTTHEAAISLTGYVQKLGLRATCSRSHGWSQTEPGCQHSTTKRCFRNQMPSWMTVPLIECFVHVPATVQALTISSQIKKGICAPSLESLLHVGDI